VSGGIFCFETAAVYSEWHRWLYLGDFVVMSFFQLSLGTDKALVLAPVMTLACRHRRDVSAVAMATVWWRHPGSGRSQSCGRLGLHRGRRRVLCVRHVTSYCTGLFTYLFIYCGDCNHCNHTLTRLCESVVRTTVKACNTFNSTVIIVSAFSNGTLLSFALYYNYCSKYFAISVTFSTSVHTQNSHLRITQSENSSEVL